MSPLQDSEPRFMARALMLARRAGRKTAIPFGPWMILGAWTGVFAGEAVGRWYVDLFVGA